MTADFFIYLCLILNSLQKMKTLLLLLVCIIYTIKVQAQKELFKVVASTGNIQVLTHPNNPWINVVAGNKLNDGDRIRLIGQGYLSILHTSGKALELRKEGNYSISELSKNINLSTSGISQRFANYVLKEISKVDNNNFSGSITKQMAITGAVERSTSDYAIQINMPKNTNLIDTVVTLAWQKIKDTDLYLITLSDKFAKIVFTRELTDTVFSLNVKNLNLEPEDYYYWSVASKNNPKLISSEYTLNILSMKTQRALNDTLDVLARELGDNKSAISNLILASFYEQHKIMNRAMDSYKEAIRLEPNSDDYKKAFALFLIRNGLFDQARQIWAGRN